MPGVGAAQLGLGLLVAAAAWGAVCVAAEGDAVGSWTATTASRGYYSARQGSRAATCPGAACYGVAFRFGGVDIASGGFRNDAAVIDVASAAIVAAEETAAAAEADADGSEQASQTQAAAAALSEEVTLLVAQRVAPLGGRMLTPLAAGVGAPVRQPSPRAYGGLAVQSDSSSRVVLVAACGVTAGTPSSGPPAPDDLWLGTVSASSMAEVAWQPMPFNNSIPGDGGPCTAVGLGTTTGVLVYARGGTFSVIIGAASGDPSSVGIQPLTLSGSTLALERFGPEQVDLVANSASSSTSASVVAFAGGVVVKMDINVANGLAELAELYSPSSVAQTLIYTGSQYWMLVSSESVTWATSSRFPESVPDDWTTVSKSSANNNAYMWPLPIGETYLGGCAVWDDDRARYYYLPNANTVDGDAVMIIGGFKEADSESLAAIIIVLIVVMLIPQLLIIPAMIIIARRRRQQSTAAARPAVDIADTTTSGSFTVTTTGSSYSTTYSSSVSDSSSDSDSSSSSVGPVAAAAAAALATPTGSDSSSASYSDDTSSSETSLALGDDALSEEE